MPIFYRGAGVGSYYHQKDARITGFTPHSASMLQTPDRLMQHIARGTTDSPYISLTRSYGVAVNYALNGFAVPSQDNPAYVYEIEIVSPMPQGIILLDPVKVVADAAPSPLADVPYQHDGEQSFLVSVVDLSVPPDLCLFPPGGGTPRTPNMSIHLETLVRALRDAEILANLVPVSCVRRRIDVW